MAPRLPVVVVGVDGSEESEHALRWAAEYTHQLGGVVHVITVWHQPVQFGYRLVQSDADLEDRARKSQEKVVAPVREQFPAVDIRTRLLRGHVVDEFMGLSKQADLLVLGNRGHGAFGGMLLGSAALKLVQHAHCPVTVVR
ncbi:nucleotide-binding universal stress UspA family protein [Halopolyspora algeriensis]|uniref:Nucleotide-binding universal stress UspA family protein n=1 Tax=Halopolyspora algeriensis TaxID=1500506 RepID=A0A368VRQ6_9ACTN|nr:universal stress protein [Halopolyspora algeriensis]RCW43147.1 nucleotide-binding universal stress UspA family protein [Halopolyspora algeriensis]TQM56205.1 nucleotide-binding universal stress UspA family protein [Halopolyspora algeriensis]